jgi:succinate dehydrogenase/fumarate reductase iron-sulfur protein
MVENVKLKVFRYNRDTKESEFNTFELPLKPGITVLSCLFEIQDKYDDSLSFRYSCRGAVCGTCAMLINKVPRLACRSQIQGLLDGSDSIVLNNYPGKDQHLYQGNKKEILIEPLPNLPVIKDLVVDMEKFFKHYRKVQPYLRSTLESSSSIKESLMDKSKVTELEQYTNCILCAACFGACPVNSTDIDYMGPAALVKLFRFYLDPRDLKESSKGLLYEPSNDGSKGPSKEPSLDQSRLLLANNNSGWWGCQFHLNCKRVCPKGVQPNIAIGKSRKILTDLEKNP